MCCVPEGTLCRWANELAKDDAVKCHLLKHIFCLNKWHYLVTLHDEIEEILKYTKGLDFWTKVTSFALASFMIRNIKTFILDISWFLFLFHLQFSFTSYDYVSISTSISSLLLFVAFFSVSLFLWFFFSFFCLINDTEGIHN